MLTCIGITVWSRFAGWNHRKTNQNAWVREIGPFSLAPHFVNVRYRWRPNPSRNAYAYQKALNGFPFFFSLDKHGVSLVGFASTVTQRTMRLIQLGSVGVRRAQTLSFSVNWSESLSNALHPSMSMVLSLPNALWPTLSRACVWS